MDGKYQSPCETWMKKLNTKIINNVLHYQVESMKHVMETHIEEYYWTHVSDWRQKIDRSGYIQGVGF